MLCRLCANDSLPIRSDVWAGRFAAQVVESVQYRKSNNLASSVLASNKSKLSEQRAAARASISFLSFHFFISFPLCTANPWCVCVCVCADNSHIIQMAPSSAKDCHRQTLEKKKENRHQAHSAAATKLLFRSEVANANAHQGCRLEWTKAEKSPIFRMM